MLKIILILLPAVLHVYIFVLESLLWGRKKTSETFKVAPENVEALRPWAFNQGFYNLFLAVMIFVGFGLGAGTPAGLALILAGAGAIFAAGLVLVISTPALWRSALIQMVPAALGIFGTLHLS